MRETESPTTRSLLRRIAAILDVSPSAFLSIKHPAFSATGPTPAECEAVVTLYRRIGDPSRRVAIMKLLREMAETA